LNADGRFTQSVPLVAGRNAIPIVAVDGAGNSNSTTFVMLVDLESPPLNITFPRDGWRTVKKNITINGTTEPFATISAGEFFGAAGADGRFAMNVSLLYGNNTLIVKARDRAGNTNSLIWHVVRERSQVAPAPSPWAAAIIVVIIILAVENLGIYWYFTKRKSKGPSTQLPEEEEALPYEEEAPPPPKRPAQAPPAAAPSKAPPQRTARAPAAETVGTPRSKLNWDEEEAKATEQEGMEMPVQVGDEDDDIEEF